MSIFAWVALGIITALNVITLTVVWVQTEAIVGLVLEGRRLWATK